MNSTIIGLVAAIAVLSGGLGLALTAADFDDQKLMTSNVATGLMTGHLTVEAWNADGELIAYRQTDNEVVDDGEQCILKMLFATSAQTNDGRGEYTSTGDCNGILTGAWDIIAIGSGTTDVGTVAQHDKFVQLETEITTAGLVREYATTKTWTNGTGDTTTNIVLAKTFTKGDAGTIGVTESGLFNMTTVSGSGMLAHQTFTSVSLTNGDSITVTWTFTVGN